MILLTGFILAIVFAVININHMKRFMCAIVFILFETIVSIIHANRTTIYGLLSIIIMMFVLLFFVYRKHKDAV